MATTRRKRAATRQQPPPGTPPWAAFAAGFICGCASLVLLWSLWPDGDVGTQLANANQKPSAPSQQPPPFTWSADDILRSDETVIEELAQRPAPTTSVPPANARYFLQAGSFTNAADANAQRGDLLLHGLDPVFVEPAALADGSTWHRVIVGPFRTVNDLTAQQSSLKELNVSSIMFSRSAR